MTADRKLLIALSVTVPLLLALVAFFTPDEDFDSADISTYSVRSGGAKATFEFIQELGYNTARWEGPLSNVPDKPGSLLIVAQRFVNKENSKALETFAQDGGTVLVAGFMGGDIVPADRFGFVMQSQSWHAFPAGPPQAINRGVAAITLPKGMYWRLKPDDAALFADGNQAMAVALPAGKGRVIWVASPLALCNAGLKAPGNAEFLANVLRVTNPAQVYWYSPGGSAGGKRSVFLSAPVLALGGEVLFIFALVLWTHSRRFGPVHPLAENTSPMAQLEFVHTLGSLYQSANAANVAVEIAYRRFIFLVARHFGIPQGEDAAERLVPVLARSLNRSEQDVASVLKRSEEATHTPDLRPADAAEYMNQLRDWLVTLKLIRPETQEKS
jgi:hypothetical protein